MGTRLVRIYECDQCGTTHTADPPRRRSWQDAPAIAPYVPSGWKIVARPPDLGLILLCPECKGAGEEWSLRRRRWLEQRREAWEATEGTPAERDREIRFWDLCHHRPSIEEVLGPRPSRAPTPQLASAVDGYVWRVR